MVVLPGSRWDSKILNTSVTSSFTPKMAIQFTLPPKAICGTAMLREVFLKPLTVEKPGLKYCTSMRIQAVQIWKWILKILTLFMQPCGATEGIRIILTQASLEQALFSKALTVEKPGTKSTMDCLPQPLVGWV